MFLQELSPLYQEFIQKPIAFTGGFVSGLLRLNPNDDPLRSWLSKEMGKPVSFNDKPSQNNGNGPQSINIE